MNVLEQCPENESNNLTADLQLSSLISEQQPMNEISITPRDQKLRSADKQFNSTRQRSDSLPASPENQSVNILDRHQSVTPIADISDVLTKQAEHDDKQQTSVESHHNSPISITLKSSDLNHPQALTLEKRTPVSLLDQNILPTLTDIIGVEDANASNLQMVSPRQLNIEHELQNPLLNHVSLQEIQHEHCVNNFEHKLLSNQNQDKLIDQKHLPSSLSTPEKEHHRLQSIPPMTVVEKQIQDDEIHLRSISHDQNDTLDAKLTSVDQENIFKRLTSPNSHNNQLEESLSQSLKPKLIIENTDKTENKHSPSRTSPEEESPTLTASQRRSKLSLIVRRPKSPDKQSAIDQSSRKHVDINC